jgi:hypothetical protein
MQTIVRVLVVATGAAIMVAACSTRQADSTSPKVTDDRLGGPTVVGTWVNVATGPLVLYRESMTLTQTGDHVMGTGTYAMEAGRTGPTTIEGNVAGKTLTLTITRDYGLRESFTGKLTDATHLAGTLDMDGFAQSFSYAKQ